MRFFAWLRATHHEVDISFTCIEGQQDAQQHGSHKRPLATPRQTLTPGKSRNLKTKTKICMYNYYMDGNYLLIQVHLVTMDLHSQL